MITPIIIPTQTDCIVVDWKKYCEDIDLSPKMMWIFILLFVAFFIYFVIFVKASDRWNSAWIFFWIIPAIVIGFLLFIFW